MFYIPRKITKEELQNKINTLSLSEILGILNNYSKTTGTDINTVKNELVTFVIKCLNTNYLNNKYKPLTPLRN